MSEFPACLSSKDLLFTKHFGVLVPPLSLGVKRLIYASDYAGRKIDVLQALLREDDCLSGFTEQDYRKMVAGISFDDALPVFSAALRQFRHRHLLRLLIREYSNISDTRETMQAWSDCADAIITHTRLYCEHHLSHRFGKPRHDSGKCAQFYLLAMGKLGGRELNFSSDIDLICAFSASGHTSGNESISNQEFYSKLVQQLILVLQNVTIDGFVFRVDLRLRPNGESGPLVLSLAAMETYYQEQGRDWERYAMVKARLIDADDEGQQWFYRLMRPFVYRRYIDFSVIESMRSMKAMIEREVRLNSMLDDIKRGRGGIREVEFIIQSFQLIRGGRLPQIQHQNAMQGLFALKEQGLLTRALALQKAYLFLRKFENALQTLNDQQTHSLPTDSMKQAQITVAMRYTCWADLLVKLHQYQRIVSSAFHAVLSNVDVYEDEKRLLVNQLQSIWQGHVEDSMAVNLLESLGFQEGARCYQMLYAFRHGARCRRLTQTARMRLDRFMVLLLGALTLVPETDKVLLQVLRLLENIVGRSAYLALLTENPSVLNELLHWFLHSSFITSLVVTQPFLLEVFIDQDVSSWRLPSKNKLKQTLQASLRHAKDVEHQDDVLRQFKLTCWLWAARAELHAQYDSMSVAKFLTDVAEVIIIEVLACVCEQLGARDAEYIRIQSQFAIVAYGTLGSFEMNYNSDVDLVFLHTLPYKKEHLLTRLTQKILHRLTTRTQLGLLYAVDTRLRPSGSSGLLVSHVEAFVAYQRQSAWTWEHQALLRARILFANRRARALFFEMKKDILLCVRDKTVLRKEVLEMRGKISKHIESDGFKQSAGGLLDLEFLVQFLVLSSASDRFLRCTNTGSQLYQLLIQERVSREQYTHLRKAYRTYHKAQHQQVLQEVFLNTDIEQGNVSALSNTFFANYSE